MQKNRRRLYDNKAVPPSALLRSLPAMLGKRIVQMYVDGRFFQNGQWVGSNVKEVNGDQCEVRAGVASLKAAGDHVIGQECSQAASSIKVSRYHFADYQYCITAHGDAEFNWGEQLFSCMQFDKSYTSRGWVRRPIGRRLEQFLGLPASFEGGSEFYGSGVSVSNRKTLPLSDSDAAPQQIPSAWPCDEPPPQSPDLDVEIGLKVAGEVPVSFFYGKNDWMPWRAAQLISEKIARHNKKNVPLLLLRNAGHQMPIDNPKGFVQGLKLLVQGPS